MSVLLCRIQASFPTDNASSGLKQRVRLQWDDARWIRGGETAAGGWRIIGDVFGPGVHDAIKEPDDFKNLDGEFIGLTWDNFRRLTTVVTDKMGVWPLYYCRHGNEWMFSTHASALLAAKNETARPNLDYLARYLTQSLEPLELLDESLYEGVCRLPAAHYAVIDASGGLTIAKYWDFADDRPSPPVSLASEEAAEEFRRLLFRAVNDRLAVNGKTGVSVSGGLDSSSIFCIAHQLCLPGHRDFQGISYVSEESDSDERAFVRDVEQLTGRTIDKFRIADHLGFIEKIHEQVATVEAPFTDQLWGVTASLYHKAQNHQCVKLLSGHWGDQVLFSVSYLADLLAEGKWGVYRRHRREIPNWIGAGEWRQYRGIVRRKSVKRLFPFLLPAVRAARKLRRRARLPSRLYRREFAARALQSGAGDIRKWATARRSEYQSDLFLQARSRYHQDCLDWNFKVGRRFGLDVSFPFYDARLISFLYRLPGELQNLGGRPRGILREAMRGVLPESVRSRTWKSDFSVFINRTLRAEGPEIQGLLGNRALVFELGILDRAPTLAAVERMLGKSGEGYCAEAWEIADIVALEIWLQQFLKGDSQWVTKNARAKSRPEKTSGSKSPNSSVLDPSPN